MSAELPTTVAMPQADSDPNQRPNRRRPTSMIALSFSAALDDAFLMSDTLDSLSQEISKKRQSITFQKTELEQLESKLREMEVELQEKQAHLPSTTRNSSENSHSVTQRRKGLEAILEPGLRDGGDEEEPGKAASAMRPLSAVSQARPPSSPAQASNSNPRQAVQKRRKTVDSRSRNLPSRGRP